MEQVVLLVPLSRGMVALSLEPKLEKKWYLAGWVGPTCLARSIDHRSIACVKFESRHTELMLVGHRGAGSGLAC
jgi:hypothetical protein